MYHKGLGGVHPHLDRLEFYHEWVERKGGFSLPLSIKAYDSYFKPLVNVTQFNWPAIESELQMEERDHPFLVDCIHYPNRIWSDIDLLLVTFHLKKFVLFYGFRLENSAFVTTDLAPSMEYPSGAGGLIRIYNAFYYRLVTPIFQVKYGRNLRDVFNSYSHVCSLRLIRRGNNSPVKVTLTELVKNLRLYYIPLTSALMCSITTVDHGNPFYVRWPYYLSSEQHSYALHFLVHPHIVFFVRFQRIPETLETLKVISAGAFDITENAVHVVS